MIGKETEETYVFDNQLSVAITDAKLTISSIFQKVTGCNINENGLSAAYFCFKFPQEDVEASQEVHLRLFTLVNPSASISFRSTAAVEKIKQLNNT